MLNVFISYASEDLEKVEPYYFELKKQGFTPWMDKHDLIAGQDWKLELSKVITSCDCAIIFLSQKSTTKTGYVQKEMREFLELLKYRPEGAIYLIPAKLEECETPHRLEGIQHIELSSPENATGLIEALEQAAVEQSKTAKEGLQYEEINVISETLEETWQGSSKNPGYEVRVRYPQLQSAQHSQDCNYINQFMKMHMLEKVMEMRSCKLWHTDFFEDSLRTKSERLSDYHVAFLSSDACSIIFSDAFYNTGAAHSNFFVTPFNFILSPLIKLNIHDFFKENSEHQEFLADYTYRKLIEIINSPDKKWVKEGTKPYDSNFDLFTFTGEGIHFHFPPYRVASYADGSFEIKVPYNDMVDLLNPEIIEKIANS